MPDYNEPEKIKAREENITLFRKFSGSQSIPVRKQYWTLCAEQDPNDTSEIVQLTNAKLLTTEQFHGIDRNEVLIAQNRIWHPNAHWFSGDWLEVIQDVVRHDNFNPAMIYLDTTSFADHHVGSKMVVSTMMLCPPKTLLLANLMLNDPRSSIRFDPTKLIDNINHQVPSKEITKWHREIQNYRYNMTGKTEMQTYVMYKE